MGTLRNCSHLEVDHVPESLEVHDGGLLLAGAVGAVVDQPGELLEAALLVHQEAGLPDRRPDLAGHVLVGGGRRLHLGLPSETGRTTCNTDLSTDRIYGYIAYRVHSHKIKIGVLYTIQGDHCGSDKPPVDFKTNVVV